MQAARPRSSSCKCELRSSAWELKEVRRHRPSALCNQSEGCKSLRCQASNMCFTASSRRRLTLRSFRDKLMVVDLLVIDLVLSSSSKAFFLHDLNQRNYEKLCTVNWKSIYNTSNIIKLMKSCRQPIKGAVRGQRNTKMWKSWQSWWASHIDFGLIEAFVMLCKLGILRAGPTIAICSPSEVPGHIETYNACDERMETPGFFSISCESDYKTFKKRITTSGASLWE